jgi:predicted aconitase with swiveling domain
MRSTVVSTVLSSLVASPAIPQHMALTFDENERLVITCASLVCRRERMPRIPLVHRALSEADEKSEGTRTFLRANISDFA